MSSFVSIRPDWLTKEFLEKLLLDNQNSPQAEISITDYNILDRIPKGNYYSSIIFAIDIKYNVTDASRSISNVDRTVSLILKLPIAEGALSQLMMYGIYEKEFRAYVELMPKLNAIVQNQIADLLPTFFHNDKENVIIVEDVTSIGYQMADRKQLLDYDHAEVTLKCLSKFHAASVKLHDSEPELIETFGTDRLFSKNMDEPLKALLDPLYGERHVEMVIREFRRWPETHKFVKFLYKLKPKIWDIFISSIYPSHDEFTVLNHGDLWTGNMMFKYAEDNYPQTLKFLDFQMLRYTSPTVELLNFLYTSVRYDVLKANFQKLTALYLTQLNLNLEKYGSSKRLDEIEFRNSLKRREIYALIQCIIQLAYNLRDCTEASGSITMLDTSFDEIPVRRFVENSMYRRLCALHLDDFSKTSWFQNFE